MPAARARKGPIFHRCAIGLTNANANSSRFPGGQNRIVANFSPLSVSVGGCPRYVPLPAVARVTLWELLKIVFYTRCIWQTHRTPFIHYPAKYVTSQIYFSS
ncbi:hypothetical protein GWI33_007231 [Rhynchophorus ferrugineus]|uniref:Uncharacterized protein n=1 Tax=Rhynchophorus ferrugineus TaxID=354439 RepID=A0A834IDX1_RHYFE|nr:hypothetical protein GWI33_007231 [Rhynchophorus ferrugineus]